ncbi:uncharacterized protein [Lolium perenne]|uniref:uncharacterized protein isoform X3 n=1 Tax=Lolium perenne TaxID=4522 RepID=UPI003A99C0FC
MVITGMKYSGGLLPEFGVSSCDGVHGKLMFMESGIQRADTLDFQCQYKKLTMVFSYAWSSFETLQKRSSISKTGMSRAESKEFEKISVDWW